MNEIRSTIVFSDEESAIVIDDRVFEVGSVEWSDESKPNEGEAVIHLKGAYEGYWMSVGFEKGVKNGKGVLYGPNHLIRLEVYFVNGMCDGEVIERDENGEMVLKCEMKNGVKNGYLYRYKDGVANRIELWSEGELKWKSVLNDRMSGYWSVYGSSGELLYVCERSDDLREMNGICYEYEGEVKLKQMSVFENGELKRIICEWKGNVIVIYRIDGSRMYEGEYVFLVDGYVREGYGKEYGEDGNSVVYSGHWKGGKKNGFGNWYVEGVIRFNGEWLNDEPNGEGSLFDENGRLLYKGEWLNGVLRVDGKVIDYREGSNRTVDTSDSESDFETNRMSFCETITDYVSSGMNSPNRSLYLMVLLDFVYGIILAYKYDSIAIRLYYDIESSYCIAWYSLLSIPLIVLECYYGIPIHLMFVDLLFIFILFYLDGNSVGVIFLRIALTFFYFMYYFFAILLLVIIPIIVFILWEYQICGIITIFILCCAISVFTQLIVFFYGKEYLEFILCSFIESYIGIVWVCKRGLGLLYDGVVCLFSIYVVIVSISLAVVYTECDILVILATIIYVGILTLFWYWPEFPFFGFFTELFDSTETA